ncbi:MAG: type III PLP-dependent enzyme [Parvularculaceae bacterium]|nr:type III PLP-dependent enzyme [Parvularculaceae bacterium]
MDRHQSALALVLADQPELPVHALRPHAATKAAEYFVRNFPGDVLYAVKANPHPAIIDAVYAGGVRFFDVASLNEIETVVARCPDARLAFMHPVKSRLAIRKAYFDFGVRIFVLDSLDELDKIIKETNGAKDLHLVVRVAVSSDYAQHKLNGKFGVSGAEAVLLLRQARSACEELGVSFHVGSQCMRPEAYRAAMEITSELIRQAQVTIDIVDVGGGFPVAYPALTPPPLDSYIDAIAKAFEDMPVLQNADLWCEPGRALCAEAGSHIVRVELRKGDALYLNDGAYGALFDAAHDGLIYPTRLLRAKKGARRVVKPFKLYGPTCDSIDTLKGPFLLPSDVHEGDYIEFGQTGAYGAALATRFNGFGEYVEAIVEDAPLMSVYGEVEQENVVALTPAKAAKG